MPKGLISPDQTAALHAREIESTSDDFWPFKQWISKGASKFPVRIGKRGLRRGDPVSGFVGIAGDTQ